MQLETYLGHTVRIDMGRARTIARTLAHEYEQRIGIFSENDGLRYAKPPAGVAAGSMDHLLFLTYTCAANYLTKAESIFDRGRRLFEARPEYFRPSHVLCQSQGPESLAIELYQWLRPRFPREVALRWIDISYRLEHIYNGDPRNIFTPSTKENERRVSEFRGFGPKIGGFYLRAVYESGFISMDDEQVYEARIPIDINDLRLSFKAGVIQVLGNSRTPKDLRRFAPMVQRLWQTACSLEGVSPILFDRALWIVGSSLCSKDSHLVCPLASLCAFAQSPTQGAG